MEETIRPDSSMIESYAYDSENQTLTVTFAKGGTYSYSGIQEEVFEDMKASSSAGKFFLANIKGQY